MIPLAGLIACCGSDTKNTGDPDSSTDPGIDCPPIPPGCVNGCIDEDGLETFPWGVTARTCEVVTNEQGCPELDFTTEDCRPGICYTVDYLDVSCLPAVECDSSSCTCPEGSPCSCALDSCTVTCEGDCIVTLGGADSVVECAAERECRTTCTGTGCTTRCGAGGRCTQRCDAAGCLLECGTATDCSQECNVPGECTCNGC